MLNIPFILSLYAGFTHAFETDHLLAMSNMVTARNKFSKAVKDGMFWGLGHTSTILIVGIVFLLIKYRIDAHTFSYFEAAVGVMLIGLGAYRLYKWYKNKKPVLHTHLHTHGNGHSHKHTHLHTVTNQEHQHSHLPAYLVGTVHGLAGSGALMLIVLSKSSSPESGLLYLLLFGAGSVAGMMLVAGAFSLPFSKKILQHQLLQTTLILVSSVLCIGYGAMVIKENLL